MLRQMSCVAAVAAMSLIGCAKQVREVPVEETMTMTEAVMDSGIERSVAVDAGKVPPAPNPVRSVAWAPLSTFSVDVDTGSYSFIRRALREGRATWPHSVRTEEFLNYFDYGYPDPTPAGPPLSLTTELAPAPWEPRRQLLLVGLQGRRMEARDLPPANLVFLIDTSGSMQTPDRLPLLQEAFRTMSAGLRAVDRVAIVAYAGSAGLVLPSTPGNQRGRIVDALESLAAGGGTDGGAGIELAYEVAQASFIRGGINRVILATDGDFNLGTSTVDALKALVAERRASGIALSTLGFGVTGYQDTMAEQLADVGNGNHAYIDDALEARKVLARELGATLHTIAADVKIQVEFNPELVAEYRLLGYENRALANEAFADDKVDAGEIGAGHDVTALYELVLHGSGAERLPPSATANPTGYAFGPDTLAEVRVRFKRPGQSASEQVVRPVQRADLATSASPRLQFAAAVAGFAERLRESEHLGDYGYAQIAAAAQAAALPDPHGERAEFADLVELTGTSAAQ
jgi:Ca-activated chloride channel family protein